MHFLLHHRAVASERTDCVPEFPRCAGDQNGPEMNTPPQLDSPQPTEGPTGQRGPRGSPKVMGTGSDRSCR